MKTCFAFNLRDVLYILLGVCVAYLLFGVIFLVGVVPSNSMYPTYQKGSIIAIRRSKDVVPARGTITVFRHDGKIMVKRVIGMPDETVHVCADGVYVDGVLLNEPYAHGKSDIITSAWGARTYIVPSDSYFMMGDNREDSLDSRYWPYPFVNTDEIIAVLKER